MPWGADGPYDLVVTCDDRVYLRVQCKSGREKRGCIVFNTHATDHGRGPQLYHGRADVFAVYAPSRDEVYVVEVADLGRSGWLRLEPTKNNQARGVRFAADHTIDRWTAAYADQRNADQVSTPESHRAVTRLVPRR